MDKNNKANRGLSSPERSVAQSKGVSRPTGLVAGYQLLFTLAFFAILLLPLRNLTFSPADLESNFYGRARLIQLFNGARLAIGDKVFPKALVGDGGWIFYTAEKSLDDYQNAIPFSERELAQIQESLEAVTASYAAQGIRLLVVIAPNKSSIYGDYVPAEIPMIGVESRLDQLIAYLEAHSQTRILDLRPALMAARQTEQVYYKTDTHWNEAGAYVAYAEILRKLGLTPYPLSDFESKSSGPKVLDLVRTIGAAAPREEKTELLPNFDDGVRYRSLALDGGREVTMAYQPDSDLPTAVVFHDSFFFTMIPKLSPHFSRVTFVPHFSGGGIWDLSWVAQEQPDFVIVEFAERYIGEIPRLVKP
jgi:hypothetical protein